MFCRIFSGIFKLFHFSSHYKVLVLIQGSKSPVKDKVTTVNSHLLVIMNYKFVFFLIAENCSGYCTCSHCLEQPGCGWCTDPSNTGKGKCIEGSYKGPVRMPSLASTGNVYPQPLLNSSMCLEDSRYNWSFIQCPGKMLVSSNPDVLLPVCKESTLT